METQKKEIKSVTEQISYDFVSRMAARMDVSFFRYGNFRRNYRGQYSPEFLSDVADMLGQLVHKWKGKGTSANGNAIMFCLERVLWYIAGGRTREGRVEAGNTEYLIDAANGLMIEFACAQVPNAHFKASDGSASPGFSGLSERESKQFGKH